MALLMPSFCFSKLKNWQTALENLGSIMGLTKRIPSILNLKLEASEFERTDSVPFNQYFVYQNSSSKLEQSLAKLPFAQPQTPYYHHI